MDIENVQPEAVSEGAESTVPAVETTEAQPQPSMEELINQKISEATKSFTEQVEVAKREIQSVKDKARAEVGSAQRQAQIAEEALAGFRGKLGEIDPDVAKDIKIAEYEARDKAYQTAAERAADEENRLTFENAFTSQMSQFITRMGIDPSDKRINWGIGLSPLARQEKIHESVIEINQEKQKAIEDRWLQKLKDEVTKIRKDIGIDSVDTTAPVGKTNEQAWLDKWGEGEIEATPENLAKAMKLQKKLYGG